MTGVCQVIFERDNTSQGIPPEAIGGDALVEALSADKVAQATSPLVTWQITFGDLADKKYGPTT